MYRKNIERYDHRRKLFLVLKKTRKHASKEYEEYFYFLKKRKKRKKGFRAKDYRVAT